MSKGRSTIAALLFGALVVVAAPAQANHQQTSTSHWASPHLPVIHDRIGSPTVLRARNDWNAVRPLLSRVYADTAHAPTDCSYVDNTIVYCLDPTIVQGSATLAVYQPSHHIAWAVLRIKPGWENDYRTVVHELGHALGLDHHLYGTPQVGLTPSIMDFAATIQRSDWTALAALYNHAD